VASDNPIAFLAGGEEPGRLRSSCYCISETGRPPKSLLPCTTREDGLEARGSNAVHLAA
jgi:hypothetical protein